MTLMLLDQLQRRPMAAAALLAMLAAVHTSSTAQAQGVTITGVSVSAFGRPSFCADLGGQGVPPTITIRHSKAGGTIAVSITDRLSDGRTIDHGSTSVSASPSGTTVVRYAFRPPFHRSTGPVQSRYYVTVSAGGSEKSVLWGRYP